MWYVYILQCQNKTLYTGVTNNIDRRIEDHKQGKGGHYTSYNRPKKILYTEEFKDKSEAEKPRTANQTLEQIQEISVNKRRPSRIDKFE